MRKHATVKGLTIAFLGPDGSGKSTVIEGLRKQGLPFARIDYFHLKPIIKPGGHRDKPIDDPHQDPPYGAMKSYGKLLYFIFQYNWGWLRNIRPLKENSSLIIFDRYFDDMLADSKRYRYGGHPAALRMVRKCIPSPDLYFILTADAQIIYRRKQEVSLDELARQVRAYRDLIDGDTYHAIDVGHTPEEIVAEIKKIIIERCYEMD